ncbi:efflux RND transporter periplasmic adaptor subunit [Daejeonella sp. H1SJ63]|uniref:efflux RND transporter periplasmic adaptor subunit n=1 Tax=Daejeonella sp. H1SJ63 TaxID=3034145 RepID=UPI0023ED05CC|nr:efflux RND transporter periplasmic adaptor subunit [Daejeonella sp. H1SJ63]
MKITIKKILYIIIPAVIVILAVIRLKSNKEKTQKGVYHYSKEQIIYVRADTVKFENVSSALKYTGSFEPFKESRISSELQGKINEILVAEGNLVKKGQAIIQLDNSLLKLSLQSAIVQKEGLEADVKRFGILVKADAIQGIQLEKAELGLRSAKVQVATLLEQINKSTIRAPFTGIVTAKLTEVGAFASPGIPLLQISDISRLKFIVNVPEADLNQFRLNQTYSISSDAYPNLELSAKVAMIGSKANAGNSFPVQLLVNNTADLKIKSGMFGNVIPENPEAEQGIFVPSSALLGTSDQPQIYLIRNGKAVLQKIVIDAKVNNTSRVSSGIKAGDVIITGGMINLFNGANVQVR